MKRVVREQVKTLKRVWSGDWVLRTSGDYLSAFRLVSAHLPLTVDVRHINYGDTGIRWRVVLEDSERFCEHLAEEEDLSAALAGARFKLRAWLMDALKCVGEVIDG